jgi:VanZ family protein
MAAIFYASSRTSLPDLPAGLTGYTGHFIGYALLSALALRGFAGGSWAHATGGHALRAVVFSSAYGVTDEFHQSFVPHRFAGAPDWVADTLGALGGVVAVLFVVRLIARRRGAARGV